MYMYLVALYPDTAISLELVRSVGMLVAGMRRKG